MSVQSSSGDLFFTVRLFFVTKKIFSANVITSVSRMAFLWLQIFYNPSKTPGKSLLILLHHKAAYVVDRNIIKDKCVYLYLYKYYGDSMRGIIGLAAPFVISALLLMEARKSSQALLILSGNTG